MIVLSAVGLVTAIVEDYVTPALVMEPDHAELMMKPITALWANTAPVELVLLVLVILIGTALLILPINTLAMDLTTVIKIIMGMTAPIAHAPAVTTLPQPKTRSAVRMELTMTVTAIPIVTIWTVVIPTVPRVQIILTVNPAIVLTVTAAILLVRELV